MDHPIGLRNGWQASCDDGMYAITYYREWEPVARFSVSADGTVQYCRPCSVAAVHLVYCPEAARSSDCASCDRAVRYTFGPLKLLAGEPDDVGRSVICQAFELFRTIPREYLVPRLLQFGVFLAQYEGDAT